MGFLDAFAAGVKRFAEGLTPGKRHREDTPSPQAQACEGPARSKPRLGDAGQPPADAASAERGPSQSQQRLAQQPAPPMAQEPASEDVTASNIEPVGRVGDLVRELRPRDLAPQVSELGPEQAHAAAAPPQWNGAGAERWPQPGQRQPFAAGPHVGSAHAQLAPGAVPRQPSGALQQRQPPPRPPVGAVAFGQQHHQQNASSYSTPAGLSRPYAYGTSAWQQQQQRNHQRPSPAVGLGIERPAHVLSSTLPTPHGRPVAQWPVVPQRQPRDTYVGGAAPTANGLAATPVGAAPPRGPLSLAGTPAGPHPPTSAPLTRHAQQQQPGPLSWAHAAATSTAADLRVRPYKLPSPAPSSFLASYMGFGLAVRSMESTLRTDEELKAKAEEFRNRQKRPTLPRTVEDGGTVLDDDVQRPSSELRQLISDGQQVLTSLNLAVNAALTGTAGAQGISAATAAVAGQGLHALSAVAAAQRSVVAADAQRKAIRDDTDKRIAHDREQERKRLEALQLQRQQQLQQQQQAARGARPQPAVPPSQRAAAEGVRRPPLAAAKARQEEEAVDLLSSSEEEAEPQDELEEEEGEAEVGEEEEEEDGDGDALHPSTAERHIWQAVLDPRADAHEVLIAFAPNPATDIKIPRDKLTCMRAAKWLNDEVINLYMLLLQERDTRLRQAGSNGNGVQAPRCHFFSSFFYNKLYQDEGVYNYNNVRRWTAPAKLRITLQASPGVLELDRIIMPIHQGVHWTCAMVDLRAKAVSYYDSLMGEDAAVARHLLQWVQAEAKDKLKQDWDTSSWQVHFPKDIPRQRNGCDCGVFAIKFGDYLGLGKDFDWDQGDMDNLRVKVLAQLVRKRVD